MFTIPPVDQLNQSIVSTGSYTVRNLMVGHHDFGTAHFLGFRNLRSLEGSEGVIDLSNHVNFRHGGVTIQNAPTTPLSDGPLLVTLTNLTREEFSRQVDEQVSTPISDDTLQDIATSLVHSMNATFGQFNEAEGTWIFLIEQQLRGTTPSGRGVPANAVFPGGGGHPTYFS